MFREGNLEHDNFVRKLWNIAFPQNEMLTDLKSDLWKEIGF